MQAKLVALLVALVMGFIAPQSAQAAPAPQLRAVPTVTQSAAPLISVPTHKRKWTKAEKRETGTAIKIKQKAQRGKKLYFNRMWKVTHNRNTITRFIYGHKLAGGKVVYPKARTAVMQRADTVTDAMVAKARCNGKTDGSWQPYGYRIRLNSCHAQRAEYAAIYAAATVAFLGAVVRGNPRTKIVVAVTEFFFTVGAIQLAICNRNSKGVRIFYITVTGSAFCRQQ
jgi:hypothetical protein